MGWLAVIGVTDSHFAFGGAADQLALCVAQRGHGIYLPLAFGLHAHVFHHDTVRRAHSCWAIPVAVSAMAMLAACTPM
jgi:hypothetical protein